MSDLIDRDYMLSQIKKARAENRTFDYDSLIDFINVLPRVNQTSELEQIKAEIRELSYNCEICTIDRYRVEEVIDKHIKENKQ